MNLFKTSNSLNVQNCENSMENFVHQTYKSFRFVKKFEFVKCTNWRKFDGKLMNVRNRENSMENCVHQMYRQSGVVEKFDLFKSTKS